LRFEVMILRFLGCGLGKGMNYNELRVAAPCPFCPMAGKCYNARFDLFDCLTTKGV